MASSEAVSEVTIVSARKPYTITKQRERWTEEEHNRFLEALKLYGRAWQRIEEHIGTKTAVQIRSHAQKFFSKLEKEALAKGVPVRQAIDIEIPPPRPKRKPSNPYPRKSGYISSPSTQARAKDGNEVCSGSSQEHTAKAAALDLEKEQLLEKCGGDYAKENEKGTCCNDKQSEGLSLFSEAPSSTFSVPATNEHFVTSTEATNNSCSFMEFVPVNKQSVDTERYSSHDGDGSKQNQSPDISDAMEIVQNETENGMEASKNFPRHAPVQILDGSLGACSQAFSSHVSHQEESAFHPMEISGHPGLFTHRPVSATVESQNSTSKSTNHHIFPTFHPPFSQPPNIEENYSSFQQMSSTFSSMILSALLHNPAAHAAASFTASFWPGTTMETTSNTTQVINGCQPQPMNPAPSMAAIAAATVAAATAWWAAHGLLPMCSPPHAAFSWPPTSATAPSTNLTQTQPENEEKQENNFETPSSQVKQVDLELSEAVQPQHSGKSKDAKTEVEVTENHNEKNVCAETDQKESSKGKTQKRVDRSSCGSNTPSGSDAGTDALEKKGNEEYKEADASQPTSEPSSRRNRIINSINDNRKEVSEEGRLAFQALFSRERLPQSFTPPQDAMTEQDVSYGAEHKQNDSVSNEAGSHLDLNSNTWESCQEKDGLREDTEKNDLLLTIGLTQGKLKTRRTGFKPYKRCSMEVRDCRVMNNANQDQENCSKRLRLEGKAST